MIAIPIVVAACFFFAVLVGLNLAAGEDFRESIIVSLWVAGFVVGTAAFLAASFGLVAWIEAWS